MRTQWLRPRALVHSGLVCSVIALAGCSNLDPYQKEYVWRPTGAPEANIAAQLVNPQDLAVGRGSTVTDTNASTLAIQHIWTDTPKSITGGSSSGGGSGSGSGSGSGNGSGTGAGPGASAGGQGGSSGGTGGSN